MRQHAFKKILTFAALLSAIGMGTGCAKGEVTSDTSDGLVGTFAVKDYYYSVIGSCSDGSLAFKYLSASGFQLWTDPAGAIIVGYLSLYLQEDGTYIADYWEYSGDTKTGPERLTGAYTVGSNTIEFDGLGTADFFELDNKFGLAITFSRDIITAGLQGQQHVMRSMLHRDGLQTYEDYCGITDETTEEAATKHAPFSL